MGKVSTTGAPAPVGGKNRRQLIMAIGVALVVSGAMLGAVVALALLPDDAPDLVSTGNDFDAIVRSTAAYSDWLNAHPDPDLVGRIYDASCACYEPRRRALAELNSTGSHIDNTDTKIRDVRVVSRPREEIVIISSVEEALDIDPATIHTTWVRDSAGRWRVADIRNVGAGDGG